MTLLHAGKKKLPGSYHSRRKTLAESRDETEAISDTIQMIETELSELERQRASISFIQQHASRFQEARRTCEASIQQIKQSGLQEEVKAVCMAMRSLMASAEEMGSSFSRLHRDLGDQYSLGKALDGELQQIKEDEQEDRDSIAREIGQQMESFTQLGESITEEELNDLRAVLDAVFQWKALVGGFRDPRQLALGRQSVIVAEKSKTDEVRHIPPKETPSRKTLVRNMNRVVYDPKNREYVVRG